jgi:hypothetical protein
MSYETTPPTDALLSSVRTEMRKTIADLFTYGNNKIARVRIEVEFGSGEEIINERTMGVSMGYVDMSGA